MENLIYYGICLIFWLLLLSVSLLMIGFPLIILGFMCKAVIDLTRAVVCKLPSAVKDYMAKRRLDNIQRLTRQAEEKRWYKDNRLPS